LSVEIAYQKSQTLLTVEQESDNSLQKSQTALDTAHGQINRIHPYSRPDYEKSNLYREEVQGIGVNY
jgi:hypothetical protein